MKYFILLLLLLLVSCQVELKTTAKIKKVNDVWLDGNPLKTVLKEEAKKQKAETKKQITWSWNRVEEESEVEEDIVLDDSVKLTLVFDLYGIPSTEEVQCRINDLIPYFDGDSLDITYLLKDPQDGESIKYKFIFIGDKLGLVKKIPDEEFNEIYGRTGG